MKANNFLTVVRTDETAVAKLPDFARNAYGILASVQPDKSATTPIGGIYVAALKHADRNATSVARDMAVIFASAMNSGDWYKSEISPDGKTYKSAQKFFADKTGLSGTAISAAKWTGDNIAAIALDDGSALAGVASVLMREFSPATLYELRGVDGETICEMYARGAFDAKTTFKTLREYGKEAREWDNTHAVKFPNAVRAVDMGTADFWADIHVQNPPTEIIDGEGKAVDDKGGNTRKSPAKSDENSEKPNENAVYAYTVRIFGVKKPRSGKCTATEFQSAVVKAGYTRISGDSKTHTLYNAETDVYAVATFFPYIVDGDVLRNAAIDAAKASGDFDAVVTAATKSAAEYAKDAAPHDSPDSLFQ